MIVRDHFMARTNYTRLHPHRPQEHGVWTPYSPKFGQPGGGLDGAATGSSRPTVIGAARPLHY